MAKASRFSVARSNPGLNIYQMKLSGGAVSPVSVSKSLNREGSSDQRDRELESARLKAEFIKLSALSRI
jgi:hypothetical protein